MSSQITSLVDQANVSNSKIRNLAEYSSFLDVKLAADSDDRHAFDQLIAWSRKPSAHRKEAQQALASIASSIQGRFALVPGLKFSPGVDPQKITFGDLQAQYDSINSVDASEDNKNLQVELIDWLSKNDAYDKVFKTKMFLHVVDDAKSVNVLSWACTALATVSGKQPKGYADCAEMAKDIRDHDIVAK